MTHVQRTSLFLLIGISILLFIPFFSAHAWFGMTFGGKLIMKLDNTCDEGAPIITGPNGRPGTYMYIAGTTIYDSGPPQTPGQETVGNTLGYMICSKQVGPVTVVYSSYPLIISTHGTSSI